jgi:heme a synthase
MNSTVFLRRLTLFAFCWTFILVMVGAWVRLSDAGLGCPDWPGCYGHITPHHASEHIEAAMQQDPHGPVSFAKAWKEMIHRYAATTLGLMIIGILLLSWRQNVARAWPVALLGVVIFQGLLGKWTVTMGLRPIMVTGHLLGGILLAGLLFLYWRRLGGALHRARHWGLSLLATVVVYVQIGLGGWVSSNYAAAACTEFPACRAGDWWPAADFASAFEWLRELGYHLDGRLLGFEVLTAIHLSHRLGAVLVTLVVGTLVWSLWRQRPRLARLILAALLLQLALGMVNIWWHWPLPMAVAHTGGAALLWLLVLSSWQQKEKPCA